MKYFVRSVQVYRPQFRKNASYLVLFIYAFLSFAATSKPYQVLHNIMITCTLAWLSVGDKCHILSPIVMEYNPRISYWQHNCNMIGFA